MVHLILDHTAYYYSVHVNEKCFLLIDLDLFTYLVPGEAPPKRRTRHKSHILKVMFLAGIARPRMELGTVHLMER